MSVKTLRSSQNMSTEEKVLAACEGVVVESETQISNGKTYYSHEFRLPNPDEFVVPPNVFIKVEATATKGTIGRLVDIDFGDNPYRSDDRIYGFEITYIIQVDGKEGTNRIARYHADVLVGHDGTTVYKRNVNTKAKEDIPPHKNKYNQTLHKDFWISGIGPCKRLFFGQVTRWSKSSVWVNPTPSVPKSKEQCITLPYETVVLPHGVDYEQTVTMAVLQGWKGYDHQR